MPKTKSNKNKSIKTQKPPMRQIARITVDQPGVKPLFVSLSKSAYDGLVERAKQEKRTIRAQAIFTLENVFGEIEVKTSRE